jgi:hypothetical protein
MNDSNLEAEDRREGGADAADAVLLLTTWDDGEAAMVRQLLENEGIPAQVVSQVPHSVWPITVDGLGEVRVLVSANRLQEARDLLEQHRRQGREIGAGDPDDA